MSAVVSKWLNKKKNDLNSSNKNETFISESSYDLKKSILNIK